MPRGGISVGPGEPNWLRALELEYAAALDTGNTYLREAVEQFGRDHPTPHD